VSEIGTPRSSKACRWVLIGSASIAMVAWVPVYRTWLGVKVARCPIRPLAGFQDLGELFT
jgi:hypothetical protein